MTQDPYYETMYILRPDIPEEEVESHVTKYRDILVETGAEAPSRHGRYDAAKRRYSLHASCLGASKSCRPTVNSGISHDWKTIY